MTIAMRRGVGSCPTSSASGREGGGGSDGRVGSAPVVASSSAALSRTLRVMKPSVFMSPGVSSRIAPAGMRPRDGMKPNTPQQLAGMRSEPPMSLPCAAGTTPAATAAAAPPDEPPGVSAGSHGLRAAP